MIDSSDERARQVAFNLLTSALLEIRAASEDRSTLDSPPDPEAEREFINRLAHLAHNWPAQLQAACGDGQYSVLLDRWWNERDRRADPWLEDRMTFFGWTPAARA